MHNSVTTDSSKKTATWRKDRGGSGRELRQQKTHRRRADRVEAVEDACIEAEVEEMEKEARYDGSCFTYEYIEDYGWDAVELSEWDLWKEFLRAA